jgi:hypothetical protein
MAETSWYIDFLNRKTYRVLLKYFKVVAAHNGWDDQRNTASRAVTIGDSEMLLDSKAMADLNEFMQVSSMADTFA